MDVFHRNLAVLRLRPHEAAVLLEAQERSSEVELRLTRQGLPVHRYRGKLLHSQWDPYREARMGVASFSGDRPWVFGFGDGYHLEALLEQGKSESVVALEPDARLLRAVLEDRDVRHVLERVWVIVDEAPAMAAQKAPPDRTCWYVHPPSRQVHRRFLEALQALASYRAHERDSLRILVVGPVYGGSYPIACFVKDSLAAMGHTVSFVDLAAFYPGYRELQAWDRANDLLRSLEQLLSQLIERRSRVFCPDLVLCLAQAPVCEESLKRLRGEGVRVAYWFVEDFRRMPYWKRVSPSTDAFFVIQREAQDAVQAAGASCVRYLPLAALPGVHEPCTLSSAETERYGSPISFVGAGYPNRRSFLARLASRDLKVWGNEWEGVPRVLEKVIQEEGRRVSTEETVKIFNASRINLNLHSSPCHEGVDPHGDFVNPRTFEIAGCRAFQLVDRRSLIGELFTEEEIVVFEDLKDAKDKIDYFLDHESERRKHAERGHQRVLREHTYTLRLKEMLGCLYEEGLEGRGAEPSRWKEVDGSFPPEWDRYLSAFPGPSLPELEDVVAMIREKTELGWEDRVFLTLMAFKEEARCKISSS